MKDENELYNPIINGAKYSGMHLYRLYDGTIGRKPFDIGGITEDGRAVGIEAKFYRRNTKLHGNGEAVIPWSSFEVQQRAYLKVFAANGGMAISYIYYEKLDIHAAFLLHPDDVGDTKPLRFHRMTFRVDTPSVILGWREILDELSSIRPRYPTPN